MPTLSVFFGIVVKMFTEKGGKHNIPHLHAEYQGHKIVVSFDGQILEGELPNKKLHMLLAWIEIHKEDLEANWQLVLEGEKFFKIDPLR